MTSTSFAPADSSRTLLLDSLRRRMEQLHGAGRQDERAISTGCSPIDELLPQGGLLPGTLVEWLSEHPGSGAGMLAMMSARQACSEGKVLVIMDRARQFYPPAITAWGIDLERLLVLRPESESDELWALDQVLRSPSVGAVWAPLARIDVREFRRLQLAAESGGTIGLLIRPAHVRFEPSWAETQFFVHPTASPTGWRFNVEVTRSRGGISGRSVEFEINYQTGMAEPLTQRHDSHPLHSLAKLASTAASG